MAVFTIWRCLLSSFYSRWVKLVGGLDPAHVVLRSGPQDWPGNIKAPACGASARQNGPWGVARDPRLARFRPGRPCATLCWPKTELGRAVRSLPGLHFRPLRPPAILCQPKMGYSLLISCHIYNAKVSSSSICHNMFSIPGRSCCHSLMYCLIYFLKKFITT